MMPFPSFPASCRRFLATVLALALTACGGGNDDATEPRPFDPVGDQFLADGINIGQITARVYRREALLLAVKHVNEAGGVLGKRFNAVSFLALSSPEAASLTSALIAHGIPVVSVAGTARVIAASKLTVPAGVLQISESATGLDVTTLDDGDLVFRLVPSDVFQGRLLAELAKQAGRTRAGVILFKGEPFGIGIAAEFARHFQGQGREVIARAEIPLNQTVGFESQLRPFFAAAPDVVFNTVNIPATAANLVNESAPFAFRGLYLFSDTIAGRPEFTNNVADLGPLDGSQGTSGGLGLASRAEYRYFRERFVAQFGLEPEPFTTTAYDYGLLAALTIAHAGRANHTDMPTGRMIRDSLRAVMNPPGRRVGPLNLTEAFQLIAAGEDVDFAGAYSDTDFDANGDVAGDLVYDVLQLDAAQKRWSSVRQELIHVPMPP